MLGGNLRLGGSIAIGVLPTYSRPIGVHGGIEANDIQNIVMEKRRSAHEGAFRYDRPG